MVAIKNVTWLHVNKDGHMVCDRCGQKHAFNDCLPLPMDVVLDLMRVYQKAHRYCQPKETVNDSTEYHSVI